MPKKPKIIVAIGGGESIAIDRAVVDFTGKKNPKALFIPTASSDSLRYREWFHRLYGKLGCTTDELLLIEERPTAKFIRDKILSADLIYVGGGNTLKMMRRWRFLGVDRLIKQAYLQGVVMAGLSAGAIVWFEWGHSDSMSFYHPDDWDYIKVKCLGLIPAIGCPHFHAEKRVRSFHAMMQKMPGHVGIALDENAAIVFKDNTYKILTGKKEAHVYRILGRASGVTSETLSVHATWSGSHFLRHLDTQNGQGMTHYLRDPGG